MKVFSKVIIITLFLTAGCLALTSKNKLNSVAAQSSKNNQKQAARDLFIKNCARCHGADGKSDNELGKKLDAPDLTGSSVQRKSVNKISNTIIYGDGEMPAFGKKLSKAEIKSLAKYVRSF